MQSRNKHCFNITEYFGRRPIRRNGMIIPICIMRDDRRGQPFIGFQPGPHYFYIVVGPANQGVPSASQMPLFFGGLKSRL